MMNSFAESGKASTVVLPSSFDSKSSILPDLLAAQQTERGLGGIADA